MVTFRLPCATQGQLENHIHFTMKRSFARFLAMAALAAGFVLPPIGVADGSNSDPVPGGRLGRGLARELELTNEQRQELKAIMQMHQPVLRPLLDQAQAERAALRDLIAVTPLDETALATEADRIAATHKEIVIASARLRADLRTILTPDQLAKLEGWRAHAKARDAHGRARLREWLLEP